MLIIIGILLVLIALLLIAAYCCCVIAGRATHMDEHIARAQTRRKALAVKSEDY